MSIGTGVLMDCCSSVDEERENFYQIYILTLRLSTTLTHNYKVSVACVTLGAS